MCWSTLPFRRERGARYRPATRHEPSEALIRVGHVRQQRQLSCSMKPDEIAHGPSAGEAAHEIAVREDTFDEIFAEPRVG
jgi:hypothetical protein